MITIFTRKELLVTFDIKHQSVARDVLSANRINYTVKVTNRQNTSLLGSIRAKAGSSGIKPKSAYEYKIYVHKDDYDTASKLIKQVIV